MVSEPETVDAAMTKELLEKYDLKASGSLVKLVTGYTTSI